MRSCLLLLLCCSLLCSAHAQTPGKQERTDTVKILAPVQKFYVGNGLDGGIFSTALINKTAASTGGAGNSMGVLRFSAFLNIGVTFNFNLSRHLGVYTGADIKNIGFIEHTNGWTYKRRTYNIGAPLGIKVGNMAGYGGYFFLGGGIDVPFNYKEKQFQIRDQKTKISEWFSSRTATFMPYVFAGIALHSRFTFKVQYYPTNFLNPNYTTTTIPKQPYVGYNVNLALLSIGYRLNYTKHSDMVKKSVQETKLM